MLNSDEFIRIVQDAAYGEFNKYVELCNRDNSLEVSLEMLNPEIIRKIIVTACNNLTELGMTVIKSIYEERYMYLGDSEKYNLMPSMDMYHAFANTLVCNAKKIDMELDRFEIIHRQLKDKIARSNTGVFGAATIGGIAAGMLLGPIGAILGGIAGGALSDEKSMKEIKAHLEIMCNEFSLLIDMTNEFLEKMVNIMIENIQKYENTVRYLK